MHPHHPSHSYPQPITPLYSLANAEPPMLVSPEGKVIDVSPLHSENISSHIVNKQVIIITVNAHSHRGGVRVRGMKMSEGCVGGCESE